MNWYEYNGAPSPDEPVKYFWLWRIAGKTFYRDHEIAIETALENFILSCDFSSVGRRLNAQYGHAIDCDFGLKNSGFCSCGRGFGASQNSKRLR